MTESKSFPVTWGDGTKDLITVTHGAPVTPPIPDPPPPPPPPGAIIPGDANRVKVGTATFPLAAVNPTAASNPPGAVYPGFRGIGQLVAYQTPVTAPSTNQYGRECVVVAGRATGPTVTNVTAIPAGGYVLSGHGPASAWLDANIRAGVAVEVSKADSPPVSPPKPTGKVLGVYVMDGVGHVSQVPPQCNRVLVAFYQGTSLSEWGGDSPAKTATDLTAWRASRPGNQVLVSLGGQGGVVVLDQVDEGLATINRMFPVDGIDFDAEAYGYSPVQAVSVARACASAIGRVPADFVVQFVPPGGNPVAPALVAAKAVQAAGFRVSFGQQGYETSITDADVMSMTQRAVDVLGASSVIVGVMIGDSHNSWTVASAESRMRAVLAKWPDIQGQYLWESSRPGTADWAARVAAVLGL